MRIIQQKKTIKVLVLLGSIIAFGHAKAQSKYWDVILLKSAEVVRGNITDSIPGESVTILAGDSLSRVIPSQEIVLIKKEIRRSFYTKKSELSKENTQSVHGIYYQGILSGGFGRATEGPSGIKVNFINGIGIENHASIGLGIGARFPNDESVIVPVFLDMRARILNTKVSPAVGFGIGGCFQPDQDWENSGQIFFIEAGIHVNGVKHTGVMITVGYETYEIFQKLTSVSSFSSNGGLYISPSRRRQTVQSITLNFSLMF